MTSTPRSSWYALAVLFGINAMNFYDRQVIGAVGEPIRKEWGLTDTQLGTLATAFILMYAIVGLPLGALADRFSRKKILGYGVAAWSALTAVSGMAPGYTWLFVSRLGVGVGEASCAPAANSLVGDLFPPQRRALALSLFMMGLPIGLFLSYSISGMIAQLYGWREAFYFAAIPGFILAVLAFKIKEPLRGATENMAHAARRPGNSFFIVLAIPTMGWIVISGLLHNFNAYAINVFLPSFLIRVYHLGIRESTNISSIVLGAVGIIGMLAGGWLGDYWTRTRANGKMLLAAIAIGIASPCMFAALLLPVEDNNIILFMLLMGTASMLVYTYYANVYASIQDVIEPSLRGTAMAVYFFAMYLLGGSFGPVITGVLSDYFARQSMLGAGSDVISDAHRASGLHAAMFSLPIVLGLLSIVLFAASRTIKKDMARLDEWRRSVKQGVDSSLS